MARYVLLSFACILVLFTMATRVYSILISTGSFIEFLPMLQRLKDNYSPADLPIHAIVPSIIGYGYSSPPPRHEAFSIGDVATLWDQLMRGLGFDKYIAQGGDLGSHTSRILGQRHEACAGKLEPTGFVVSCAVWS